MLIPPIPLFKPAANITDEVTSSKLNALAARAGMGVASVAGSIRGTLGPNGWELFGMTPNEQARGCLVYGSGSVSLPGNYPLTGIETDLDATQSSVRQLVSVSGNVVTFLVPGLYYLSYAASVELDVGGATTHTPGQVKADAELRYGGTAKDHTKGYAETQATPNLSGFLKADGADQPLVQVALGGATGKTETLAPISVAACEGSTGAIVFDEYGQPTGEVTITNNCVNVISAAELDGSNKLDITLDTQTLDATDNFGRLADYTPTGTVKHTIPGHGFVRVIRDSADSGNLKILDGATKRNPTVEIYGIVTPSGKGTAIGATLQIVRL